jgi:hypothetical protein
MKLLHAFSRFPEVTDDMSYAIHIISADDWNNLEERALVRYTFVENPPSFWQPPNAPAPSCIFEGYLTMATGWHSRDVEYMRVDYFNLTPPRPYLVYVTGDGLNEGVIR